MSNSLGDMVVSFKADVSGLSSGISQAQSQISGFGGLAVGALVDVGKKVVDLGTQAVKMAGDFQSSMTSLVTGAGESQANLQMVSDGILSMAGQVGASTKDLAAGMYMIESSGQRGAQALDTLRAAAEGAKVGAASLADVANGVTTIMTDYAAQHVTAAQATNDLIAAVAAGKTHMADLAKAMSTVLPAGAAMGVGLGDVSAAMATMTGEGTPAAAAATYLRQLLSALENPSAKAASALASVGLTSKQVSDEMKVSLPGTLQMITDALKKKFPEGSAAYVAALAQISGGNKQMQGMLELTGSHLDVFKSNVASIADAVRKGGTAITGWTLVQGDFNTKMDEARASIEAIGIKIGTFLLPVLSRIMDFVNPVIQGFGDWLTSSTGLAGALQPLGDLFNGIGQQLVWVTQQPLFTEIVNVINTTFVPALQTIGSLLGGLASNFLPQGDQIEGVSQTIMQALQTIEPVVGTVGNAFLDFSKFLQQNSGYFQEFFNILSVTGGQAFGIINDALSGLSGKSGGMSGLFTSFKPFFDNISAHMPDIETFVHLIGDTLVGAAQTIAPVIKQVGDSIGGQLSSNMKFAAQTGQQLAQWWKSDMWPAIQQALPGFEHLASVVLNDVVPGLAKLWDMGQQLVQHITSAFLPVFEKAEPIMMRVAGIISEGLAQAIHFLMPYVLQAGAAIAKFAGDIADRVAPILLNFWNSIEKGLNWLQANWKYIWPSLSKILGGIWNEIVGIVKIAWALLSGIVKVGLDLLSGNWGQAWTDVKDMLSGIWDGIKQLVSGGIETVSGTIQGFITAVVGFFQGLYDTLVGHSIIPDMMNGIIGWFSQLPGRAMSFISDLVSKITGALSGLGSKALGWAGDMMSGFVSGIRNGIGAVGDAIAGVADKVRQFLHFSKPDIGPLADADQYMPDFIEMLSGGLVAGIPKLKAAVSQIALPLSVAVGGAGGSYPSSTAAYPSTLAYGAGVGQPIIHVHNHNHNYVDGIEMADTIGARQAMLVQARQGVRQWG
jgi:TP901 family phage tail tape measure protein